MPISLDMSARPGSTFEMKYSFFLLCPLGTFLLSYIDYKTSASGGMVQQSQATKSRIWFMVSAAAIPARLFAAVPMLFYDLVGQARTDLLAELSVRRKETVSAVSAESAEKTPIRTNPKEP